MRFIAEHRARWGVEPLCRVLQIAPSSYYAAVSRPASARRRRDEALQGEIRRVWQEHRCVYGADKVWAQLKREGALVARCTVQGESIEKAITWGTRELEGYMRT